LRALPLRLEGNRFAIVSGAFGNSWSTRGITEEFPTDGSRSLYGTTKLASELLIEEYNAAFGVQTIVNRCGVITGPWQMGKVDQGFFVLWAARHLYDGTLYYSGFGGKGHQVRDVLHIADLFDLMNRQVDCFERHSGQVYNVGGGLGCSISLAELTERCAARTRNRLVLGSDR
jgi:CDP-paratose 2-epimerase